ncbi:MAG TPA: segregation/condensation protein A [Polyangia bacterium]|jgi:segregation and condensation protein A|nr:segregation/condensation protein A [Polyangia bacterium]
MSEAAPYRVALPEFEGPLDLLLHLCKTHEIEVVNLPIAFITTKYLEYLEIMQTMSVDVAADYLVMAATLAYLKSRELVPQPEPLEAAAEGEEEEPLDPREELIRRLLEYQKYKDAAEQLGGRPIEGRNVFGRGAPIESIDIGPGPVADESVWKLIGAFGRILEKASKNAGSTHNVVVDRMSIGARINQLVDRLQQNGGSFLFESCFDLTLSEPELRNQIVVTLLSILELARLKVVRVLQAEDQETLFVTHIAGTDLEAARRVHVTSADEGEGDEDRESDGAEGAEGAADADAALAASEDIGEAASEEHDVSATDETNAEGFDEGDLTDAGGGFDEEAEGDATLVEPAPAGASEAELKDSGESEE